MKYIFNSYSKISKNNTVNLKHNYARTGLNVVSARELIPIFELSIICMSGFVLIEWFFSVLHQSLS